MKILLDAMSGDNAPLEIIKGAEMAAKAYPEHKLVLVGDENVISDICVKHNISVEGIEILHAPTAITMEDKPLAVVREKRDSSMREAGIKSV